MIGTDAAPFTGDFDGGGHTITGLVYDLPTIDDVGLFAKAGIGATLENVTLHAVNVVGGSEVGALLGFGEGVTIDRVTIDGTVVGMGSNGDVGGVVGRDDCYATDACGIAPSITNTTVMVDIHGGPGNSAAGGILGGTYTDTDSATLVGLVSSGTIDGGTVGGIVGDGEPITLSQSSSSMTITSAVSAGGLVGDTVYARTSISDSFATGDITAGDGGGIAGSIEGSITRCYATGNVTCSDECGGLAADVSASVSESWASGNVVGGTPVGGLVGDEYGTGISDSFATGTVQGQTQVGGLVGQQEADFTGTTATIARCYSTSQVSGLDGVGGLVGQIGYMGSGNSVMISNSFALGSVTGASSAGNVSLLIGAVTVAFSVSGLYESSTATCTNTSGSCTVYGTAEPDATYFDSPTNPPLVDWDFTNVWQAVPNGLPTLR